MNDLLSINDIMLMEDF